MEFDKLDRDACTACGHNRCRLRYVEEVKPGRFLFWKIKGTPAYLNAECARCGKDHKLKPGTVVSD